jgi:hypothetical protein
LPLPCLPSPPLPSPPSLPPTLVVSQPTARRNDEESNHGDSFGALGILTSCLRHLGTLSLAQRLRGPLMSRPEKLLGTQTRASTNKHTRKHTHTHPHAHTRTDTHAGTCPRTHERKHARTHVCTRTRTCTTSHPKVHLRATHLAATQT